MSVVDLQRDRAGWAWACVGTAKKFVGKPDAKKAFEARYGTLARKLPAMLLTSGLGQTLAFLFSKGQGKGDSKGEGLLLGQLGARLASRALIPALPEGGERDAKLMESILKMNPASYRLATQELLACAEWLKRFAEGQLGEED
ncbi:MAG: type III-B CRISPR module-associated protein Cmr5 [Alphaproteobacteria bacterium]|nr:type III-B CRISPR module-associated protein Cmr5 [Alphaproteobacteria bacterium]